jgi:serine/threonine-protein kinase
MGGYHLLERIGQGGMGEIWRAEHRMLARPAAIKLIRPDARFGGGMPEAASRFESEAKAIAALRSPHTVAIYDFGSAAGGRLYYAMELLDGYDAETLVRRFGPLPPERAVHLIRQACDALEEVHRAGMVHRDIKPANIFVCRYGLELDFVKVLDFGLVTTSGGLADTGRRSSSDVIAGTPAYLAPEVLLGGEADWRADIYSLGCVGFFLLTGKPVFDNPDGPFLEPGRETAMPPSRRSTIPISKELDELIVACLAEDPKDRPQTAQELSDRLALLGLERDWSPRRREVWWRDHSPDTDARAESGGTRLMRRSARLPRPAAGDLEGSRGAVTFLPDRRLTRSEGPAAAPALHPANPRGPQLALQNLRIGAGAK